MSSEFPGMRTHRPRESARGTVSRGHTRRPSSGAHGCDVVLLVDIETGSYNTRGEFALERPSVDAQVLRVLREQHHKVVVVPYRKECTAKRLSALKPRLVFNLTEWVDGDRTRDREIVAMLERLKLKYTGAAAQGLALSRDKVRANRILAKQGVKVPANFVVMPGAKPGHSTLAYPLFVKPARGDGSDFIGQSALVRNDRALERRVRALHAANAGPVLCESFIEGSDLFVGLIGNPPQVLHPMRLVALSKGRGVPTFSTQRVKHDVKYQRRWRLIYRKARLSPAQMREIHVLSRKAFAALKLRDYARLDLRLTPDGRIVFIEANANPDLARDGLGSNGCFVGVAYKDVIRRIVRSALARKS